MPTYNAYFDESGNDSGLPVWVIAGYLVEQKRARTMERLWKEVLRKAKLPFFHMVDCAHGSKPFDKMTLNQRIHVQKECMKLIKRYVNYGFAMAINPKRFKTAPVGLSDAPELDSPYVFAVAGCIGKICEWLDARDPTADINFYFERGHKDERSAAKLVNRYIEQNSYLVRGRTVSITFCEKGESGIVQAADLWAWQAYKNIRSLAIDNRGVRKDFIFLTETNHSVQIFLIEEIRLTVLETNTPGAPPLGYIEAIRAVFSQGKVADEALRLALDRTPVIQTGFSYPYRYSPWRDFYDTTID